jgi:hypothetical protein
MADDALRRVRKALAAPKGGALVPAESSARDLIEKAKAASRPSPTPVRTDPGIRSESGETKPKAGTALATIMRESRPPLPLTARAVLWPSKAV